MRLRTSRRRWSILAVIGCCLGVYVVFAVAFHWFIEPTMGKSYAAYAPPAYQPPTSRAPTSRPPAAIAGPSAAVAPAASPIVPEQLRVAAAFAALPDAAEKTAEEKTAEEKATDAAAKDAPKKHAAHARHERSARHLRGPWDFASSLFSGSRRWF
jgi:hypothetical protein